MKAESSVLIMLTAFCSTLVLKEEKNSKHWSTFKSKYVEFQEITVIFNFYLLSFNRTA
jgi:hypothetical protein